MAVLVFCELDMNSASIRTVDTWKVWLKPGMGRRTWGRRG